MQLDPFNTSRRYPMRYALVFTGLAGVAAIGLTLLAVPVVTSSDASDWALNATIIEACSCTMFCPCYFSTVPTGHGHEAMAEHYCRFNMGYKVNKGSFGDVKLDGVKFW